MILGFKQYFPWKGPDGNPVPTYFREKILPPHTLIVREGGVGLAEIRKEIQFHPKLHTIRPGNRWKAGDLIHMAYGVRTKNYEQFNKGLPELERVKSVQRIEIKWSKDKSDIGKIATAMGMQHRDVEIRIDGKGYAGARFSDGFAGSSEDKPHWREMSIYQNDGFVDIFQFFRWFFKDFTGQIIHFTDLKY